MCQSVIHMHEDVAPHCAPWSVGMKGIQEALQHISEHLGVDCVATVLMVHHAM